MTDVAVTGLGLVTPAGIGVEASWAGVLAGVSAAQRDPALEGLPVDLSCRVPGFDPVAQLGAKPARRLDRFVQLAVVAAREAVADAGLDPASWDGARVGVVMGCGMGGATVWEEQHTRLLSHGPGKVSPLLIPMLAPNMVAGQLAMEFAATGPNLVAATACASGTTAIGIARDLLRSGACDIVLTGGTEAPLTPLSLAAFAQMGALSRRTADPQAASRPFDVDRDGFVAGEAAGVLILERPEDASARGAHVHALVAGYGASADAYHPTAPEPEGRGAERALRSALADAGVGADELEHVNAHGTSTPMNDVIEAVTVRRVCGDRPTITSTKGVTGHALGAAGGIEAAFTVLSVEHGTVPPTANLTEQDSRVELDVVHGEPRAQGIGVAASNSFGFGGQNAVVVVRAA